LDDDILGLSFGAHEADILATGNDILDELACQEETFDGFLDVDDVDAVAFAVDVWAHLWVPARRALPEVDA